MTRAGAIASGHFNRIALWLVALAIAAVSWGVLAPSAASAAPSKFVYEECDSALPDGGDPQVSFTVNPGVPIGYSDTCSQPNGALNVVQWGHATQTFAYLSVAVPNVPGGWVETETISGSAVGLGPGNDHSYIYDEGWPENNLGEYHRTFYVQAEPGHFSSGGGFSILINCDGNYAPGCEPGPVLSARYIAATEVDPSAPKISAVTGSLLTPGVLRGHQELSVEAADGGGGVAKIEALVNGVVVAPPTIASCNLAQVANPSYTGVAAVTPAPCPPTLKTAWTLDTAAYPFVTGANSVQVCASDFATIGEANKTCSTPQTVDVDNTCTESPVPGGDVLSAQFSRSHKEEVTVPFHATAKVTGELADAAGDAIPEATICVQMAVQGSGEGVQPVGTATTDANGRFVYAVAPGPNRTLLIGYRHDSFQVARDVRYYAHARPTIHLSAGRTETGGQIRISGKLPGGRSAAGRVVVLQASSVGSDRWFTFRRATTNSNGHFHSRYRFDVTTRTTTYRLRAVVPRQAGYPWEVGHSKPASVEVRARNHAVRHSDK
jgi:hypothetical protein